MIEPKNTTEMSNVNSSQHQDHNHQSQSSAPTQKELSDDFFDGNESDLPEYQQDQQGQNLSSNFGQENSNFQQNNSNFQQNNSHFQQNSQKSQHDFNDYNQIPTDAPPDYEFYPSQEQSQGNNAVQGPKMSSRHHQNKQNLNKNDQNKSKNGGPRSRPFAPLRGGIEVPYNPKEFTNGIRGMYTIDDLDQGTTEVIRQCQNLPYSSSNQSPKHTLGVMNGNDKTGGAGAGAGDSNGNDSDINQTKASTAVVIATTPTTPNHSFASSAAVELYNNMCQTLGHQNVFTPSGLINEPVSAQKAVLKRYMNTLPYFLYKTPKYRKRVQELLDESICTSRFNCCCSTCGGCCWSCCFGGNGDSNYTGDRYDWRICIGSILLSPCVLFCLTFELCSKPICGCLCPLECIGASECSCCVMVPYGYKYGHFSENLWVLETTKDQQKRIEKYTNTNRSHNNNNNNNNAATRRPITRGSLTELRDNITRFNLLVEQSGFKRDDYSDYCCAAWCCLSCYYVRMGRVINYYMYKRHGRETHRYFYRIEQDKREKNKNHHYKNRFKNNNNDNNNNNNNTERYENFTTAMQSNIFHPYGRPIDKAQECGLQVPLPPMRNQSIYPYKSNFYDKYDWVDRPQLFFEWHDHNNNNDNDNNNGGSNNNNNGDNNNNVRNNNNNNNGGNNDNNKNNGSNNDSNNNNLDKAVRMHNHVWGQIHQMSRIESSVVGINKVEME